MHPPLNTNFDPRISISLRFTFETTVGKVYHSIPDCYRIDSYYRIENIESLTIAVTYLQGFHAGKVIKYN